MEDLKFKADELVYKFLDALEHAEKVSSEAMKELHKLKMEHDADMIEVNRKLQLLKEAHRL